MSQWVLKFNGQIVPRRTMQKLTKDELVRDSELKKRSDFDAAKKENMEIRSPFLSSSAEESNVRLKG